MLIFQSVFFVNLLHLLQISKGNLIHTSLEHFILDAHFKLWEKKLQQKLVQRFSMHFIENSEVI